MTHQPRKAIFTNELKIRAISAIFLAAIVLLMTWIGGQTYALLWAVIAFCIFYEFSRMCGSVLPFMGKIYSGVFLVLMIGSYLIGNHQAGLWILAGGALVLAAWEFLSKRTLWSPITLIYAALPFLAFSEIRGEETSGLILTLTLFAIVWGADVFAYFAGRLIGGPKLAPSISPNKTWSGFIGGVVGSILLSLALLAAFSYSALSFVLLFVLLLTSIVSQIGDLVESKAKRHFDVKDSGALIPGHGGVLDRIDGLIFAGVFIWGLVLVVNWMLALEGSVPDGFINNFVLP